MISNIKEAVRQTATFVVEGGAQKFPTFAEVMIREYGDIVCPYLRSTYLPLRFHPDTKAFAEDMDDEAAVDAWLNRLSIVSDIENPAQKEDEKDAAGEKDENECAQRNVGDSLDTGGNAAERYPLYEPDRGPIAWIARRIREKLSSASPYEMRAASTTLIALQGLPYTTPGIYMTLTFMTPTGRDNFAWVDIYIDAEEFRLGVGERLHDPITGGDTESRTVFETQAGTEWREGDIEEWLEYAHVILRDGDLSADDESDYEAIGCRPCVRPICLPWEE